MNFEDCHKVIDERVATLKSQLAAVEEVIKKNNDRLIVLLQIPERERGEAWNKVFYDGVVKRLNTLYELRELIELRIIDTDMQRTDCDMLLDIWNTA